MSLMRSNLECGPLIWENITELAKGINLRKYRTNTKNLPLRKSLKTRGINTYSKFLFKLINNEIDDAFLLNQINIKTNTHSTTFLSE
ncbi:Reverse transcriptase domain-containing protein, partial [Aphis craccivora]